MEGQIKYIKEDLWYAKKKFNKCCLMNYIFKDYFIFNII